MGWFVAAAMFAASTALCAIFEMRPPVRRCSVAAFAALFLVALHMFAAEYSDVGPSELIQSLVGWLMAGSGLALLLAVLFHFNLFDAGGDAEC